MQAEFAKAIEAAGARLVVIDFFATWCAPCRHFAPLFRQYSLKFPGVRFIQVDTDKCNETAKAHKIESLPTIKVMRGTEVHGTIKGGGPSFIEEFANLWNQHSTASEKQRADALNSPTVPSDKVSALVQHLSTDHQEVNRLATYPLKQFDAFVEGGTRADLGLPPVCAELPFNLKAHDAACTLSLIHI